MKRHYLRQALSLFLVSLALSGCGSALYLNQSRMTQEAFLKAQASGAEELAPYEYYGAQARIEEAKIKAAHAKYGSAIKSMKEAAHLSQAALAISTKQSQGPRK